MAITERSRHHMIARLEATLGEEAAMTLAEHLPPVGWADVATRHDLDELEHRIELRFEALEHRFEAMGAKIESGTTGLRAEMHELRGELHASMASQTRQLLVAIVATNASFVVALLAGIRLWA